MSLFVLVFFTLSVVFEALQARLLHWTTIFHYMEMSSRERRRVIPSEHISTALLFFFLTK